MWWCPQVISAISWQPILPSAWGLPVKTLVCASNDNKVLYDFLPQEFMTGKRVYPSPIHRLWISSISSNLERLIYMSTGCDAPCKRKPDAGLSREGRYEVTPEMRAFMSDFVGGLPPRSRTLPPSKNCLMIRAISLTPIQALRLLYMENTGRKAGMTQRQS